MALNTNDYESVKLNGSPVQSIKRHKKDKSKFLFTINKNKKRYREIYTAQKDTLAAMIKMAKLECEKFRNQAGMVREEISPNISVNDYWERFKEYKKSSWGKSNERNMKSFYKNHIKDIIGSKKIKNVTSADIDDIMNKIKHLSRRSRKVALEVLQPLFTRAIRERLITTSPLLEDHMVKRIASEEKKVVLDATTKYKLIHNAINEEFKDDIKVRTAFLFGLSGRRLTEVLTLEWSDIDLKSKSYQIRADNSKVNSTMTFALNQELTQVLTELKKQRDSIYIFSSNRNSKIHMTKLSMHYDTIRETSKLQEFTFHWMRNVLVSALAGKEGIDVTDLSALLGHNDTGTLKKYLSLQREESSKKAANAIEKILL